jgi:L-fuconolactonase
MTLVIDAHVHLWDRARHPQAWIEPGSAIDRDYSADDLRAMLAATGSDSAVLVQSTNSVAETADLLAVAAAAPVAAVVGWIDLTGDVPAQLAGLDRTLLRGVRHLAHLDPDPRRLLREDVAVGLSALAAAGLPFDLVLRAAQLPFAAEIARAHPDLTLVLDHLGNPPHDDLEGWGRHLAAFAAEPSTVAKVSGRAGFPMVDLDAVVGTALEAFGPTRLMHGSDWPVAELVDGGAVAWASTIRGVADGLAPAERAALLGGTAARVYGIAS